MTWQTLGILAPRGAIVLLFAAAVSAQDAKVDYVKDVRFGVDQIEKECRALLSLKKIDWKKATAPLLADAKKVKTDGEHLMLLWRLLARLHDGHAEVQPLERGKDVQPTWPDRSGGPGLFLCRARQKLFIKNAWGPAAASGLAAGMEVTAIGGQPAAKWLDQRVLDLSDLTSFSTTQQAFFFACHQGLAGAPGTSLDFEVVDASGHARKCTVTYEKLEQTAQGPAFAPATLEHTRDLHFGRTQDGFGYVHVRRCKEDLPAQMDEALEKLGDVPGMILDFRGNSGGAFDHAALFGRFLAKGDAWLGGVRYESAGEHPYAGPMVVIVDATVRSAGETASGMFQEDGRAYMIGESATAGMASTKKTIELPSRMFALYVSVASNKGRFQGGKGIEGIGIQPHELVEFDAADLVDGRDTLIRRAEVLLRSFPKGKVKYVPSEHGWKMPK